jgi:predicted nucleic acid-binding protein
VSLLRCTYLDTNVVSELRKTKPHGAVLAWLQSVPDDRLFISALTLGELQAGAERTRKQDQEKAANIEAWIDQLADAYEVIPMDANMFREWARLMEGRSDQLLEDAMIAATARVRGLTVATRNVRDFKGLAVEVLNPFTPRT